MSRFKVLKPYKTKNIAVNPSFEAWTGNFSNPARYPTGYDLIGTAVDLSYYNVNEVMPGRGTDQVDDIRFGSSALRLQGNSLGWTGIKSQLPYGDSSYDGYLIEGDQGGLTVSFYAKVDGAISTGAGVPNLRFGFHEYESSSSTWIDTYHTWTLVTADIAKGWQVYTFWYPWVGGIFRYSIQSQTDVIVDGLQIEQGYKISAFTEGNMPGCRWESSDFTSPSIRTSGGGFIYDFKDDLGTKINWGSGLGTPDFDQTGESYGSIDGGYINDITVKPRQIVLGATLGGSSMDALLDVRRDLGAVLLPERYPNLNPLTLQFTRTQAGVTSTREIEAFYDEGLGGNKMGGSPLEQTALRFTAYDPMFRAPYQEAWQIGASSFNFGASRCMFRYPDHRWGGLSVNGTVRAMKYTDDSRKLYIAGDFTADQFDGSITGLNRVAVFDMVQGYPYTGMGTGFNGSVYDMAYSAKWGVIVVGGFTLSGGGAAMRGVARWDETTLTWTNLVPSTAPNNIVQACTIYGDTLYVGGLFTSINGQAISYMAQCDLTTGTWSALTGGQPNANIYSLWAGEDGGIIAGGDLTAAGSTTSMGGIGRYYNGKWYALGTGVDFHVTATYIGRDKTIYAGGYAFVGTTPAKGIIVGYNGSTWYKLGDGGPQFRDGDDFSGAYRTIGAISEDSQSGDLIVTGSFTQTPGLVFNDKVARFSKNAWYSMPIDLPGTPTVYCVATSKQGHVALGFDTTGSFTVEVAQREVMVGGNAPTYPFVKVSGPGTLQQIRNHTTGQEINCKYTLLSGEWLIMDLRPGKVSAHSNFFGDVSGRVFMDGSDLSLVLLPGKNEFGCYLTSPTSQSAMVSLYWYPQFWGLD